MRTLPTIAIIILLLLGGSLLTYRYIQTSSQTLGTQLEAVEQAVSSQKWAVAQQDLNTVQQTWTKTKTWWTVLLDHQEIDNIDLSLKRVEKYIATQHLSLSLGEVSALKLLVGHISETEEFTWQNIF